MLALIQQYRLILLGLALLAAFSSGVVVQGWWSTAIISDLKAEHAEYREAIASEHARKLLVLAADKQALETRLAALDGQHYQELTHAQQTTKRLTADLAAARQRLSVRTTGHASGNGVSASTGTAGVDDGSDRAELHPAVAAELAALAGDADRCAVKLTALQAWAREVEKGGG